VGVKGREAFPEVSLMEGIGGGTLAKEGPHVAAVSEHVGKDVGFLKSSEETVIGGVRRVGV